MFRIFIIGCGSIGHRVARRWQARGGAVSALTRDPSRARALAAEGIDAHVGDLDRPESLTGLPLSGAHIIYTVPPPGEGDTDPRVGNLLEALDAAATPRGIVYVSTAGVYGDRAGAWVDETIEPRPQTGRARRRLAAENALRDWGRAHGTPVTVLRVGGIYGPDRLPRARLERGTPVLRIEECGYTNRIHAEDLARACLAVAERGDADAVYNATDGRPGTMTEYFYAVADRLGLPRPPALTMAEARRQLSPGMLSYLEESRRLDSRKLREGLDFELLYPTLAAGLAEVGDADEPGP